MILRLFNGKHLVFQFGIILVFLASMFKQDIVLHQAQGFGSLYQYFYQLLEGNNTAIHLTYYSLIIAIGLILQLTVSYYKLIAHDNFIILLIWPILAFSNPALASINPVLFAAAISSWALFRLLSTSIKTNTLPNIFTSAFLFSVASLFYGNLIWYVFFMILALLILSIFRAREVAVSLFAFALAYIYLIAYDFVFDYPYEIWNNFSFNILHWTFFSNLPLLWVNIGLSLIISLFSIYGISILMLHLFSKLINIRKFTTLIFSWFLINIILLFLSGPWWFAHPIIIFIPLSILLSIFLSEQKSNIYIESVLLLIIILELFQTYYFSYA